MKVIGITGGVGSGKSKVLAYLQEKHQVVICQADQVAWTLQEPGQECYHKIVDFFGKEILGEDQKIDRKKLGSIVFQSEEKLCILNQMMHPAVKTKIKEQMQLEMQKGTKCFAIEAALLLEDHYNEICDEIWYICADEKVKRQRLKESRSYTDEKIDDIMRQQLSDDVFREKCDIVVENSGDFRETCSQIDALLNEGDIDETL